jgi:cyclophilin family peptidyl-prolyl cis-trans isomerase
MKHVNVTRVIFFALIIAAVTAIFAACAPATPAPQNNPAAPTATTAGANSSTSSDSARPAAARKPADRNNMYSAAPKMTIDPNKTYRATIETSKGNIVMDLYPKDAPQHVNNFVFLANQGFFDGLTFHRYEPGFVIQGGDPLGQGTGGPGYTIPPEIKRTHPKGAVAMARRGGSPETTPSSGSQFYITLDATPNLDGAYTSFGQVTEDSMSVVEQIRKGDVINKITIEEK